MTNHRTFSGETVLCINTPNDNSKISILVEAITFISDIILQEVGNTRYMYLRIIVGGQQVFIHSKDYYTEEEKQEAIRQLSKIKKYIESFWFGKNKIK